MDLSISVVSWNTSDLLDQCVSSIYEASRGIAVEIIVVDNASSDGSQEMIGAKHKEVKLIANEQNVGFSRANNQALKVSTGRYFLLLNPDTICAPDSLTILVRFLDDESHAGAVGPLVLNDDNTLQYSWARFPSIADEALGRLDRYIKTKRALPVTAQAVKDLGEFEVDWVGGCCLMIRRDAINQVGLMDESLFMYSEELDWCYRLRMNSWQVWVEPEAQIVHLGGRSSSQASEKTLRYLRRSKAAFFAKHHGKLAGITVRAVLELKALAKKCCRGANE